MEFQLPTVSLDSRWQEEARHIKRDMATYHGEGAKRPTPDMGHSYHKSTGLGAIERVCGGLMHPWVLMRIK